MIPFFTQAPPDVSSAILLLLDRNDRIIGIRMPKNATKEQIKLSVGDLLFERLPIGPRDRVTLKGCRQSLGEGALLLHAGDRPMLMLCHLYGTAGLTPVLLPVGKLRRLLDHPAAYRTSLEGVVMAPTTALRHKPMTDEGYLQISESLQALRHPFDLKITPTATLGEALARLSLHIALLARLFGCTAVCSFRGLSATLAKGYLPYPTLAAVSTALMAAGRLCAGCEVTITGKWVEGTGPMLCITLPCAADGLPEVAAPMAEAHGRGMLFEILREDGTTRIRFAICMSELSVQGFKGHDTKGGYTEIARFETEPQPTLNAPQAGINLFCDGQWAPGKKS